MQIFLNLVANNYKSHVIVNRVVIVWLISTNMVAKDNKGISFLAYFVET